jgi:hypothetical protein
MKGHGTQGKHLHLHDRSARLCACISLSLSCLHKEHTERDNHNMLTYTVNNEIKKNNVATFYYSLYTFNPTFVQLYEHVDQPISYNKLGYIFQHQC